MLVLTRKYGEAIMIGDDIKVIITRIEGNSVRVAISAPEAVAIYREELYSEINRESDASDGDAAPAVRAVP